MRLLLSFQLPRIRIHLRLHALWRAECTRRVWNQFSLISSRSFRSFGMVSSFSVCCPGSLMFDHTSLPVIACSEATQWCGVWWPDEVALKCIVIFTIRTSVHLYTLRRINRTGFEQQNRKTRRPLCLSSGFVVCKALNADRPGNEYKIEKSARKTMNVETASPKKCANVE